MIPLVPRVSTVVVFVLHAYKLLFTLDEVPNENRPSITNENQHLKQQSSQVKKKVKRSHRTQLAAIHNKTSSVVPSLLPVIDVPSPIIEEDAFLLNSNQYYHAFSVYSSLDIHLNDKQTYRGDLEMLGYNLIVWSGGRLPWDKKNSSLHLKFQRETIPSEKKLARSNVNEFVKKCFFMKLISPVTLRAICDYMSTVYQLNVDDMPNFDQLRAPIKEIVKALGFKVMVTDGLSVECVHFSFARRMPVFVCPIRSRNQRTRRTMRIVVMLTRRVRHRP
jgi:hypothetical protein